MAAALFNSLVDPARARAISAGTAPVERVHPEVVEAMQDLGCDLSGVRPTLLTDELARTASLLVTLGCGEACPLVRGLERIDWSLEDPAGQSLECVRAIRDRIQTRVRALIEKQGWARQA
jgi:arsenate reductase